jgi:hypothetical protein
MRFTPFALILLGACSSEANHLGNPLFWPVNAVQNGINNAAYSQRRGSVEVIVKSEFPAILTDIDAGGGPVLTRAMEAALIPVQDRPTRVLQLQGDMGLYSANPGALVTALMVFGG